jgi:aminocarboxymuconate-semialdehyde decarboxylase
VSHGGGYMPYYMGRIDRNYIEKANTRINMSKPPIDYLRMLYFDSCVYDRSVLQHLVDKVGAERVLLGSDYPVGEARPVEFVTDTNALSATQKEQIVRTNAATLLGVANSQLTTLASAG